MGRVYVLGGGPAGLALVDGLVDASELPFTLIERESTLGGLAKTLNWEGVGAHDLGPHKIFSVDQALMARVEALLKPQDWLEREKKSRIFLGGHFLPYPPSPFSLLKVYGGVEFAHMIADFARAKVQGTVAPQEPDNFAADLSGRVGQKLYERMFRPIAEKLWGDPRELDLKLSKGRVQTPSIAEIILRMLKLKKTSEFEALTFKYPKGGLQKLWERIQAKGAQQGEFLLQHEVTSIQVEGDRVRRLTVKELKSNKTQEIELEEDDMIFSTLPLKRAVEAMTVPFSKAVKEALDFVRLNDLVLVFIHLEQKNQLFEDSWFFVPDAKIPFHRVSEQRAFDPGMTPNGTIVCCELMSTDRRPLIDLTDDELVRMSVQGLADMGFRGLKPDATRVMRLRKSYPVFVKGFEEKLELLIGEMDRIKNFKTVGRQGAFNYIGTLDAMDIGYGAARWLLKQKQQKQSSTDQSWREERTRTKLYPVLD